MAGEGHVFDMISRMKSNNSLRKNKGYYKKSEMYLHEDDEMQLRYKEVSEQQLRNIKHQIQKDALSSRRLRMILFIFIGIIGIVIIIWGINFIS